MGLHGHCMGQKAGAEVGRAGPPLPGRLPWVWAEKKSWGGRKALQGEEKPLHDCWDSSIALELGGWGNGAQLWREQEEAPGGQCALSHGLGRQQGAWDFVGQTGHTY